MIQNGGKSRPPRVVGGYNATEGQFKYVASLQVFNKLHYCGGAIISHRTILTAAHCAKNYDVYAMIGSIYYQDYTAKRYHVKEFIKHEDFDPVTLNYDIALAILNESIDFDDDVEPIPLVTRKSHVGERMVLSGWGYTNTPPPAQVPPNQMQWMQTNVVTESICDDFHPDVDTNVCVFESKDHGICSGDSGGPLVNGDGELVGVISAGYACALGYPDSCTDVYMLKDWIIKHSV